MKYFTIKKRFFLPFSDFILQECEIIDKYLEILEESGVGEILESVKLSKKKCKGRIGYNPYNLFATIVYCFANFKGSLRDIEDKCRCDVRILYLMECGIPDHSTIGNFINEFIIPYQYEIFTTINKAIIKRFKLNIDTLYIDGTKFEADANKYKFVWKPIKFHKRLDAKIKDYISSIGYTYKNIGDNFIKSGEFFDMLEDYANKNNIDINNIPSGRGCRRTKEEKNYKIGKDLITKLLEYEEKEEICGEDRNSYFKTDIDATAMVLKEDYYSRSSKDFHAAYNIQVGISSGLILMYGTYQYRTDFPTLKPFINNYYIYYGCYPENLCADSGYGSYENYLFLKKNNINNYVKYPQWGGESSGKRPQLFKLGDDNNLICLNGIVGKHYQTSRPVGIKNGSYYIWNGCNECSYTKICKKSVSAENKEKDYRIKCISIEYELLKEEAKNNLLSPAGIKMRINRSIQSEGTFGQIKGNMLYDRLRRTGMENVSGEIMLMCLGVNIRRLLDSFDDNKFKNSYWEEPDTLHSEVFPECKVKKETVKKN